MELATILSAIGLALGAPAPAPLGATGSADDAPTPITVKYSDLDLSSSDGVRELHDRVGQAISDICRESTGDLSTSQASIACKVDAWRQLRPRMERTIAQHQLHAAKVLAATGN